MNFPALSSTQIETIIAIVLMAGKHRHCAFPSEAANGETAHAVWRG